MMRSTRVCVFLGLVVIAAMAAGCGGEKATKGPKTYAVTGTVTLNGQPVSGASVSFAPSGKGAAAVGKTDASGKFTLKTLGQDGAAAGDYMVGITKHEYADAGKGSGAGTGSAEMPADYKGGDAKVSEAKNALPEKFENPATSTLKATVTEDPAKNVFEFKL